MGVTKRAKRAKVRWVETVRFHPIYDCPNCKVTYHGGFFGKNTTRFRCDCGQELIVEELEKEGE